MRARNERTDPVTRLCLALETARRAEGSRLRSAEDLLAHYFPHDEKSAEDRLFLHMPSDVRAPIMAAWGIRGLKTALRDDDARVRSVVHEALLAQDLDAQRFEAGLTEELLLDWSPLGDYWRFWRGDALPARATHLALTKARELGLLEDLWLLRHLHPDGNGTDAIARGLRKDQLVAWIRALHESADGSPEGIIAALGWDTLLTATPDDALLGALDALAADLGLLAADHDAHDAHLDDPSLPPRAEPGDMGFDLAYGIGRGMGPGVKPQYNFSDEDDEPTRDLPLPPERPLAKAR